MSTGSASGRRLGTLLFFLAAIGVIATAGTTGAASTGFAANETDATATIEGTLDDETGAAIQNATVTIDETGQETITDGTGSFSFDVDPGERYDRNIRFPIYLAPDDDDAGESDGDQASDDGDESDGDQASDDPASEGESTDEPADDGDANASETGPIVTQGPFEGDAEPVLGTFGWALFYAATFLTVLVSVAAIGLYRDRAYRAGGDE